MPTKSYTATMKDIEALRYFPSLLAHDIQAIQAEEILAPAYKAKLVQRKRDQYEVEARDTAKRVWERANKRVRDAQADLERVINSRDQGIDWAKLQTLASEYSSRIRNLGPGQTLPRVLAALADDARTPEAKRAFALAAADVLNGPQAAELGRVRDVVNHWQAADDEARHAAEVELRQAEQGVGVIRDAILEAEQEVTGVKPPMWSLSPWQQSVLGETRESLGHVVWKDTDADYFSQPMPTPAAPSGIED